MPRPKKHPDRREGTVIAARFVFETGRPSAAVAHDLGVHPESLRTWARRVEGITQVA